MQEYMFVSDSDGCLYDTRVEGWSGKPALRENFKYSRANIVTCADLKATLRAGAVAWPGCYPLFFYTSDGGALSFKTVKEELSSVLWSIQNRCDDGWRVVGCDVNWEDPNLYDDHTSERIESAYAED